jgi:nitroimidazol reductase NimA-like FMN-containing flavoprotein (pyridoxamine 5'-phosphate oxidase superfamily)
MSFVHRSAPYQVGAVRAHQLSDHECRAWLQSHREGRLGYQTGRGPRSVVVSYAIAGDRIMFRLPDYNDIVHYAPGEQVTLKVEGKAAATGDFEEVSVKGKAVLAGSGEEPVVREAKFEEAWPTGVSTRVICLPMTEVEGIERRASV